jgi:hypothetical protein
MNVRIKLFTAVIILLTCSTINAQEILFDLCKTNELVSNLEEANINNPIYDSGRAQFPGGDHKLTDFMSLITILPKDLRQELVSTSIFYSVLIEVDGSVSLVKFCSNDEMNSGLPLSVQEELIKLEEVIKNKMPKWTPAKDYNSKPMRGLVWAYSHISFKE